MNTRLRVLKSIQEFWSKRDYSPSLEQIAEMAGIGTRSGAHYHVQGLKQEGLVDSEPHIPRSVRLTDKGREKLAELILQGEQIHMARQGPA